MSVLTKDFLTPELFPSVPPKPRAAEHFELAADSLRTSGQLRLRVHGESMLPALWPGDIVEIESCPVEEVQSGDIVLALRDGRFFLHRFLRHCKEGFILRGDSMPGADPPYANPALLGRVARIVRRKQDRQPSRAFPIAKLWPRAAGWFLCYCGPARRLALKIHGHRSRLWHEISSERLTSALPGSDPGVC